MPTRTFHRIWCKSCNNFQLHDKAWEANAKFKCNQCDTEYSDVLLSEIPKEKIIQQRKRYNESQKSIMNSGILGILTFGMGIKSETEIMESDAGQREIDEANKLKRAEERKQRIIIRQQQEEEAKKYAKLGRNNICVCGSGKKYKKCCLPKIESYNI